jgi:predicted nicotinamide N-methyase
LNSKTILIPGCTGIFYCFADNMSTTATLQTFFINQLPVELFVPADSTNVSGVNSLYWAKVWPSAIGLCYFLQDNKQHIQDKKVMELAAGLGLPSVFTASYAQHIFSSDIEPAAVALLQQTFQHHQFQQASCRVLDWNNIETVAIPDTLLLSDINYEPGQFDNILVVIKHFLDNSTTIILSTPQRLMAKDFISQLLPWCRQQAEVMVMQDATETAISVFVLKK